MAGVPIVSRGDIVLFDFAGMGGVPLQKTRPALVVQNDGGNRHAPQTILAAIRGDAQKALPVMVAVPKGVGGLTKDSVVDCGFLSTTRKELLGRRIGRLPPEYMRAVDEALRVSLALK